MLSVEGHPTGADILVGSPGTSDVLNGLRGRNTYVVGGGSSYVVGRRAEDRLDVVNTSGESDWVYLTPSAPEYVHINASSQGDPGNILTATSGTTTLPVRGSNELSSFRFASCPAVTSMLVAPAAAAPTGTNPSPAVSALPGCPDCQRPSPADWRTPFPGSPTLRGFDVGLLSQHRILLPADQYLFKGKSLHQEQAILVLVVEGVQLPPSRPVTAQQLKTLLADAKGFSKVASPVAPLVYFTQNGLLVFSQNAEPLGSRRNPGRVIARLLARDGQPVVLRQQPGQPFALAKFVRFTPPSTAVRTEPSIAPTP